METKKAINIAIDGPSGVGKSSLANLLAKELNYIFINTGSFYRALAYLMITKKWTKSELMLNLYKIDFSYLSEEKFYLNQQLVSDKLRRKDVTKISSDIIAKDKKLRQFINNYLNNLVYQGKGYVLEGRDTTFRVAPSAEVRIFLTASAEVRAQRRLKQNAQLGIKSDYKEILEAIKKRDFVDQNRQTDPLHIAQGVTVIENDNLDLQATYLKIVELINNVKRV